MIRHTNWGGHPDEKRPPRAESSKWASTGGRLFVGCERGVSGFGDEAKLGETLAELAGVTGHAVVGKGGAQGALEVFLFVGQDETLFALEGCKGNVGEHRAMLLCAPFQRPGRVLLCEDRFGGVDVRLFHSVIAGGGSMPKYRARMSGLARGVPLAYLRSNERKVIPEL